MEKSNKSVAIVKSGEGKALSVVGDSYRIVMPGKDTGGAYAVIEMLVPPGGGPGPHSHAGFQESFYVLEGEVEIKTEAGAYTAGEGSFVNIPLGGMVHCFKNKTDQLARLWCVVVPAGLDAFFEEIGEPGVFGTFARPTEMTPERIARLEKIAEKYGQKLFPPNFLG